MYSLRTAFGVFAAAGLCASSALGQSYVATIISPAGYSEAFIEQAGSGQQVGFGRPGVGTNTHALIWSGTSQSFIDVNPTDYDGSFLYGVANGQQVGVGFYLGIDRAGLWNGTAASYVDLSPADTTFSVAYGTDGTRQVGYAATVADGPLPRAFTWTGTAASAVNIHSSLFDDTVAYDTRDGRIVGVATAFDTLFKAVLWTTPTPEGAISINPPDFDESVAYSVWGSSIGGNGNGAPTGFINHAILWLNDGATYVDLHPGAPYFSSFVFDINATQQVGIVSLQDDNGNSEEHAAVWSGTPGSFVDLHGLIPGGLVYEQSRATGIDVDGSVYGWTKSGDSYFAVRWTPVVAPARCNAADIAYDDGAPLPPVGVAGGTNNGVTEGDYNLFFARFFDSDIAVDIANDDGSPLPPFGPLATNNGVTEGDYNLFFSIFFDGCAF